MSLGKRPRVGQAMRRTTSLAVLEPAGAAEVEVEVAPPAARRKSSPALVETALFLRECGLCKRKLGPGQDAFIYRGEIAYCSLECRQQQINLDERKDKCQVRKLKADASPTTTERKSSSSNETVAAA